MRLIRFIKIIRCCFIVNLVDSTRAWIFWNLLQFTGVFSPNRIRITALDCLHIWFFILCIINSLRYRNFLDSDDNLFFYLESRI